MKTRAGLLVLSTASILVVGACLASPSLAAEKMITKAPPLLAPAWWYEGYVEVGGRFYLNDPDKTTLGKFYQYRDLRPGVFGNFRIGAHRTVDPLDIEFSGKNVGWRDQEFGLDYAKPGDFYLTLGWNQIPQSYYNNARSTYSGFGTSLLTTPTYPTVNPATTNTVNAATQAFVDANSSTSEVRYRRDIAHAKARWTPNDSWDFAVSYDHTHRHGTQVQNGVTWTKPDGRVGADTHPGIEFVRKVDDVTQNGTAKGEYSGSTPWGKPFNVMFAYAFSLYNNDVGCPTVAGTIAPTAGVPCTTFQNPWPTAADPTSDPPWNRMSLEPSNEAHTVSVTSGVGLPFNSRYMGTARISWLTQNEPFLPSTINPLGSLATLTSGSLNGDATTTLINNVLHTQITKTLKSTLRYRYYDYDSHHGPTTVTGWNGNPDTGVPQGVMTTTAYPAKFNKQNATAQLVWRPMRWLNTGAAYLWERRSRELPGVVVLQPGNMSGPTGVFDIVTHQNAVKVFGDASWNQATLRGSLWYGQRRYEGDYIKIANNNNAFRTVDVQDRNSTKGQTSLAYEVTPQIVITPTGGFRIDDYSTNGVTEFGINSYRSWNAGGDVVWMMNRRARFFFSYVHDNGHRETYQSAAPSNLVYDTHDFINVFIVGGKFVVIPDKLFLHGNFTYTRSTSQWASNCGPGGCGTFGPVTTPYNFPDSHNTNYRLDIWAKYVFDDAFVKSAGWTGKAFIKARVVWEKNVNDSWQSVSQILGWTIDPLGGNATTDHTVFLATGNPNYNVVVGSISFGVKW